MKGGFLIAAIVGLYTRATIDMDAKIKGLHVTEEMIMQKCWKDYQKDFDYAIDIEFNNTLKILEKIMDLIQILLYSLIKAIRLKI